MCRAYTREELARAAAMHASGMTWQEIGLELDRPSASLKVTVSRFRRGLWSTPARDRSARLNIEIEHLVEAGITKTRSLANKFGMSCQGMHMRLRRIGFDAETLNEYKRPPAFD